MKEDDSTKDDVVTKPAGKKDPLELASAVESSEDINPWNSAANNQAIEEAAKVCGQPRWLIFALLGVLLTGAIGVGLGITLSNGGDAVSEVVDALAPTLAPSEPPTFAPTFVPTLNRRNEVEKILSAEIPSFQLGSSQIEALNWLADDDPANLDFELVPPDELLERFVVALLYFSMRGENWVDSFGFLSPSSVCWWNEYDDVFGVHFGVLCDPMVVEIRLEANNLRGQLPTELGLLSSLRFLTLGDNLLSGLIPSELGRLTRLQGLKLCKFATLSSSELDTTISLPLFVLQFISSTVL
jgi:hypothetical protein